MKSKSLIEGIMKITLALIFVAAAAFALEQTKQLRFSSPDEAVRVLVAAVKDADIAKLLKILGAEAKPILDTGDDQADQESRERFLKAFALSHSLQKSGEEKILLEVGKSGWQFPFPIVKEGNSWLFDAEAGEEEIQKRRIGKNELSTIQAILAYVDAQREYYLLNPMQEKLPSYAQKFKSTPGLKDGLYYPVKEGETPSPLGEIYANAQAQGTLKREADSERPSYYGYYYRILTSQGPDAPGKAYDYVVNGKLFGGHALIAWPAHYDETGIMTFIVNQDGIVYEKDLGIDTAEKAAEITSFNPDASWKRVKSQ